MKLSRRGMRTMYNRLKLTYPEYFKDFRCVGGKCEDTCCKEWDIEIDKDTFDDYCSIEDEKNRAVIMKSIRKNNECTSNDLDYGVIKLNDQGICPFLEKSGLCAVYLMAGEEYLSNICTHFPRIMNKVDNQYEISLDVACLEAAKLILGKKDGIRLECGEKDFKKYIINDEYNTNSKKFRNSPIKYFKEIREFSIEIMQDRRFDLSRRLYILGDFIDNLEKTADDDSSMILQFMNEYDIEKTAHCYKRDNMDYMFQIIFFSNIVHSSKISKKAVSSAFRKYTEELLKGFSAEEIDEFKENSHSYMNAFDECDRKVIQKYEYIFENYLVNFMYSNMFPFSESDIMFEGYIMLLVRYSFIRFYLVGIYIQNGIYNANDIIRFISVFGRTIEHDKNFLPKIADYIEENKYDNMDFAKKLI